MPSSCEDPSGADPCTAAPTPADARPYDGHRHEGDRHDEDLMAITSDVADKDADHQKLGHTAATGHHY